MERQRPNQPFEVVEDGDFTRIMSAEDLCMIDHLDDLTEAGVTNLKIEGRAKSAYYVGTVVNAYRQVLDGASLEWAHHELETISHRPYSTGFYYGRATQCHHHPGYERTHDWALTVERCTKVAFQDYAQYAIMEADELQQRYPDGMYLWEVVQRNKFCEGDRLEVLSPGKPVYEADIRCLWRVNDGHPVKEAVANHAAKPYYFLSPVAVEPKDLVRLRRSSV